MSGGYHAAPVDKSKEEWTHVVLNYNSGQNILQIFQDGLEPVNDNAIIIEKHTPGDGRIVIGRRFTGSESEYTSVQVNELLLFNKTLIVEEIGKLNQ